MFDKRRIRAAFDRAAARFESADFLHSDIRTRLIERLRLVQIEPKRILDLGAGGGAGAAALALKYPGSTAIALDSSLNMLAAGARERAEASPPAVCAEAAQLPVADACIDLVFSNLMLHHCPDPVTAIREARRVLRFPGLLAFSTLGPDTLRELRAAWASADDREHVSPFMDMHDLGDALVHSGFAEPVLDVQRLTVTYESVRRLMEDLRGVGSTNALDGRNRALTGKRQWQRMLAAYEKFRNGEGRLPATLEIVFGIAWCGASTSRDRSGGNEVEIAIDRLRKRRS